MTIKTLSNKRGTMRIYTPQRIAKMTSQEKQDAIEAVRSSNTLTVDEKEANLSLLESKESITIARMQIKEGAADIGDIHE